MSEVDDTINQTMNQKASQTVDISTSDSLTESDENITYILDEINSEKHEKVQHKPPISQKQHYRQNSSVSSIASSSGSDRSRRSSSLELIHDDLDTRTPHINRTANSHNAHRLSISSTSNSRKRMSLNFTPLPVIGSTTGSSSRCGNNSSNTRESREFERDSKVEATNNLIVSNTINFSPSGSAKSSSNPSMVENYLSELASKERKVVELRDELKRVQEALRKAEIDLRRFREEASLALGSPGRTPNKDSGKSHSRQHSNSSPADKAKRKSQLGVSPPLNAISALPKAAAPIGVSLISSQTTPIPASSTMHMTSQETSHHPRPTYSFEEDHTHNRNSNGYYTTANDGLESSKDYLNMGKRVVEELGSQFWGLFEDIKNVTMGEEARDGFLEQTRNERSNIHSRSHQVPQTSRQRTNNTTSHSHGSSDMQPHQQRQRSASNSYYIL